MNSNDSSNLWWWICTGITAIGSIWLSNLNLNRGKVIARLQKEIAKQDEIIEQKDKQIHDQNKQLQKLLNDYTTLVSRKLD